MNVTPWGESVEAIERAADGYAFAFEEFARDGDMVDFGRERLTYRLHRPSGPAMVDPFAEGMDKYFMVRRATDFLV